MSDKKKPTPYQRLRVSVEALNRIDRGIPDEDSANLSPYQQWCIHRLLAGEPFIGVPIPEEGKRHVHGPKAIELGRVLHAFSRMAVSRREFTAFAEGRIK